MAMNIDLDQVSEIMLSDNRWYKLEPGSFSVDNVYYGYLGNENFQPRLATDPGVEDTMGFSAKEKGSDTTLCGRVGSIKAHRTIPVSKLPAEVIESRKRAQDPFLR